MGACTSTRTAGRAHAKWRDQPPKKGNDADRENGAASQYVRAGVTSLAMAGNRGEPVEKGAGGRKKSVERPLGRIG